MKIKIGYISFFSSIECYLLIPTYQLFATITEINQVYLHAPILELLQVIKLRLHILPTPNIKFRAPNLTFSSQNYLKPLAKSKKNIVHC